MKVKVLRPFWYEGVLRSIGALVDLPEQLGREVVFGAKAERVIEPPAKPASEQVPVPQSAAKQTMTTKSAGALAGKQGD